MLHKNKNKQGENKIVIWKQRLKKGSSLYVYYHGNIRLCDIKYDIDLTRLQGPDLNVDWITVLETLYAPIALLMNSTSLSPIILNSMTVLDSWLNSAFKSVPGSWIWWKLKAVMKLLSKNYREFFPLADIENGCSISPFSCFALHCLHIWSILKRNTSFKILSFHLDIIIFCFLEFIGMLWRILLLFFGFK